MGDEAQVIFYHLCFFISLGKAVLKVIVDF